MGKTEEARGSDDARALGNQAAGSACLRRRRARSWRFSGERDSRTGRAAGVGTIAAFFFAAQQDLLEVAGVELARVLERGAARLTRDLVVVRAIGQQARECLAPGSDILLRDFRHGHHLLIEAGFVFFDGADG